MKDFYKKTNGLGNPIFEVKTPDGACKIIFDSYGYIVKAFCGQPNALHLVFSPDDQDEACLKDAMYEMLILSQECFLEMFNEIKSDEQRELAKDAAKQRNAELTSLSITAALQAIQLNSII